MSPRPDAAPDPDPASASASACASASASDEDVPATAVAPRPGPDGYLVEEIRDGLYWVTDGSYHSLLLDGGDGAVVVDAPPSLAGALPRAVDEAIGKPVTHVVYSHAHGDHIGAAGALAGPRTQIVASTRTAALLAERKDPNRPAPTLTFGESLTLHVGRQEMRLAFRGANHSPDNVFVHFPRQRTVLLVDVVLPGWVPFRNLTMATDVPGYLRAHEQLLEYDVDTVVGGHHRLGTPDDVEAGRAYLRDLAAATAAAMRRVGVAAVAADVGTGHLYRLAEEYSRRVAEVAAEEVAGRWSGRLGGVAVYAHNHAVTMADALRYDYNVDGGGAPPAFPEVGHIRPPVAVSADNRFAR